ncbi:MAG: cobalt-precorrin-5B (C(1))-methyltransferase CbiD [Candidatus Adiutrix sp.]|jgi:cobalt-precorrin-5B (C1)-methyltransferase|nr:cobalt-precorrin-5B (C(1))-methyltransferase CbiD [Candidatus Adiutrix sp.]
MNRNGPKTGLEEAEEDPFPPPPDRPLKAGFTTGTAATAAALAALRLLSGEARPETVRVKLPGGGDLDVPVAGGEKLTADEAVATVVKDAGDDPDVTNGAIIGVRLRRLPGQGLTLTGGRGVGRVTKPGLALPPGEWAINPGPRAMISANLAPFPGGLNVEIFVEKGEELAALTLNPRLGIAGGLSILGTTGLVKPFSHEAYLATIDSALSLARALGFREVVLTTGRQSEKLARGRWPDLAEEAFVQIADFFSDSLSKAAGHGFESISLAVFFGKAVKQAAGLANTHARRGDQDPALLAEWLAGAAGPDVLAGVARALTARGALDILKEAGLARPAAEAVAARVLAKARAWAGPGPGLKLALFDYDGELLASARLD